MLGSRSLFAEGVRHRLGTHLYCYPKSVIDMQEKHTLAHRQPRSY